MDVQNLEKKYSSIKIQYLILWIIAILLSIALILANLENLKLRKEKLKLERDFQYWKIENKIKKKEEEIINKFLNRDDNNNLKLKD